MQNCAPGYGGQSALIPPGSWNFVPNSGGVVVSHGKILLTEVFVAGDSTLRRVTQWFLSVLDGVVQNKSSRCYPVFATDLQFPRCLHRCR
jgi:hypothetical protein